MIGDIEGFNLKSLCLSIFSVFLKSNHVINLESMWTSSFA